MAASLHSWDFLFLRLRGTALATFEGDSADCKSVARWKQSHYSIGGTIWIADAHRDDGKRFVMRADEKLTAFLELESAIRGLLGNGLELQLNERKDT